MRPFPVNTSSEFKIRAVHDAFESGSIEEMTAHARALVVLDPDGAFGWQCLGIGMVRLGKAEVALSALERALCLDAGDPTSWDARGVVLQSLQRLDAALDSFARGIAIDVLNARAYYNQGLTFSAAFRRNDACESARRAAKIEPKNSDAWGHLAFSLKSAGRAEEAVTAYEHALVLTPGSSKILGSLGSLMKIRLEFSLALLFLRRGVRLDKSIMENHYNLAACLLDMGDPMASISYLQGVLVTEPGNHKVINGLAMAFRSLKDYQTSIVLIEKSIRLRPYSHEALNNRGTILRALQKYSETLDSLRSAVVIRPDFVEALTNLGTALMELRNVEQAINYFERAFVLDRVNWTALWNASLGCLSIGLFEKGWALHEYRFPAGAVVAPHIADLPYFKSDDDSRCSVLLCSEQGVGDEIMFGSMITDFSARVGSVIVCADPRLCPLFRRSLPTDIVVVPTGTLLPIENLDAQLPFGSLGLHVRKKSGDFLSSNGGYLRADPSRVKQLGSALRHNNSFIIGLSWQTTNRESSSLRNVDLASILRILSASIPDASFLNLQYGVTPREVLNCSRRAGVGFIEHPVKELNRNLDDVAALISVCDVVVTIGNTIAHLCGALGKKAAVMLPYTSSWRWMASGTRTPWYGSLELFRKRSPTTEWEDVISEVAEFIKTDATTVITAQNRGS